MIDFSLGWRSPPDYESKPKLEPFKIQNCMIRTNNLMHQYPGSNPIFFPDIQVEVGKALLICGESGCGKTTLLRCIAGLETQTSGSVIQKNIDISFEPPSNRDFGIVFQSYALFPNLSVFSNISYGLINNKWKKDDIKKRVDELLDLVNLTEHASKYPSQLSGGEQQRVALARALATSPGLLLLDEPLSALDAKVRVFLRKQIRDLQRKLGVTTIMVTHDQEEAQTMADRIFVMNEGEIIQSGTPSEIYTKANSPFIASFIGSMNFIPATIDSSKKVKCNNIEINCDTNSFTENDSVQLAVRPEEIYFQQENQDDNVISATIKEIEFFFDKDENGNLSIIKIELELKFDFNGFEILRLEYSFMILSLEPKANFQYSIGIYAFSSLLSS